MSISPSEKIKVTVDGHVAVITIDNPAANTWDVESLPALKAVVEALNADRNIYALVLTGAGEKFFSAGADLTLFADGDPAVAEEMAHAFGNTNCRLGNFLSGCTTPLEHIRFGMPSPFIRAFYSRARNLLGTYRGGQIIKQGVCIVQFAKTDWRFEKGQGLGFDFYRVGFVFHTSR